MASTAHASRVCLKLCLIYPVAWACYVYAVLTLPMNVAAALLRTLSGVKGRGVDELLASFFTLRGSGESDKELLRGLRETHRDQLEDSDSRYRVSAG